MKSYQIFWGFFNIFGGLSTAPNSSRGVIFFVRPLRMFDVSLFWTALLHSLGSSRGLARNIVHNFTFFVDIYVLQLCVACHQKEEKQPNNSKSHPSSEIIINKSYARNVPTLVKKCTSTTRLYYNDLNVQFLYWHCTL